MNERTNVGMCFRFRADVNVYRIIIIYYYYDEFFPLLIVLSVSVHGSSAPNSRSAREFLHIDTYCAAHSRPCT